MLDTVIGHSASQELNSTFRDTVDSLFDNPSQLFPDWEIKKRMAFFGRQVDTLKLAAPNNARGAYAVIRAAHGTTDIGHGHTAMANDVALTIGWDKDPKGDNRALTLQSYGGGISIHDDRIVPITLERNPRLVHRLAANTGWRNQLTGVSVDNLYQCIDTSGEGQTPSDSFRLDSVEIPRTSNTEEGTYIQIKPECNGVPQRTRSVQIMTHYNDITVTYPVHPNPNDKTNPHLAIHLDSYQPRILRSDAKIHTVDFIPLPNVLTAEIINKLVRDQIAMAMR